MTKIFISYSHADSHFVHHLERDLEELGADLWIDHARIRAGHDWLEKIEDALADCSIMLLIISPDSMTSKVVKKEYEHFLEQAPAKTLIPVYWRLAEVPLEIQKLHYIDFRTPQYNGPFVDLCHNLDSHGIPLKPIPLDFNDSVRMPGQQRPLPLDITSMIRVARYDLWINGIALDTVAHEHFDLLKTKLDDGVRVWLMSIAPEPAVLNATARWLGTYSGAEDEPCLSDDEDTAWFEARGLCSHLTPAALELGKRVLRSLRRLCQLTETHPFSDTFQIRVMHERPSMGYLIVDLERRDARLTAAPYLYDMENVADDPPGRLRPPHLFYLAGQTHDPSEKIWFERYVKDYRRLWNRCATRLDCDDVT